MCSIHCLFVCPDHALAVPVVGLAQVGHGQGRGPAAEQDVRLGGVMAARAGPALAAQALEAPQVLLWVAQTRSTCTGTWAARGRAQHREEQHLPRKNEV